MPESYADLLTRHRADVAEAMFGAARRLRWPAERLAAERERRLRELLAWSVENSPFHAERLAGIDVDTFGEADLATLPIMTRADLTHEFDRVVTDRELTFDIASAHTARHDENDYVLGKYRIFSSSGTTGDRVLFAYGWDDWTTFVTISTRWRGRDGSRVPLDATIGSIFATSTKHISGALHEFSNDTAENGAPSITHLAPTVPLPEIVAGLNAAQPVILQGYPSMIGLLAGEARAGRLKINPQRVVTCGEQCDVETRTAVADAWGVELDDYWGCSEGAYAFPCEARDGMHLPDDLVIIEPIDEHGNAVEPGRPAAKILLTNLFNHAQPLIRYEITDAMTVTDETCACGCAHRRITDLAGRGEVNFVYDNGAVVYSMALESVLVNDPHVTGLQVSQTPRGADVAVIADAACDIESMHRRLVDLMAGAGVADPQVSIREVAALERLWSGKVRKFQPL
jgi:phenylacetate-CoA ligase